MIPIQVPTGEISNEEANELADEILLRGEFLGSREPGRFARAVDRVIGWIGDALDRIFSTIFGGAGSGAGVTLAYILLAVAIVVLLLAIWRAIKGRTPKDDEADDPGARIVFDELVDPNELRTDLAARTASGDWRGAVVTGFRLAVVALIDAGVAVERPGATAGDFGRAVDRNRPELSDPYTQAASRFNLAFYSDAEIVEGDYKLVSALLSSLDRVGAK